MINIEKNELNYFLDIHNNNKKLLKLVSLYLNKDSCYINKKMIDLMKKNLNYNITNEHCFKILLEDYLSENIDLESEIHQFVNNNTKRLNPKEYYGNPYYNAIKLQNIVDGNWEIKYQDYEPYEAFIYKNQVVYDLYKTRPSLGYFDKQFSYLTVFQNDREWMAIKPNEIETMKEPINYAKGKILTFGLGLGYFAYMVSLKEDVESITIIEKDEEVINIFKKYVLPQFKHENKIQIICTDAYEYYETLNDKIYDFVFIDIWHDVSDGLNHYLRFKSNESKFNKTKISYWIESEIIIFLRSIIVDILQVIIDNIDISTIEFNDSNFNFIYNKLYLIFKNYNINSFYELLDILNDENIKKISKLIYKKEY